ncbi:MAG: DUF11 domain-containing protein, partial [Propionibacteriaceae bacterium]|nr:DUF11 domain-containing protein [Propionibacteriaceae bacterium]
MPKVRRLIAALSVMALVALSLGQWVAVPTAHAANTAPFVARFVANASGAVLTVGNNLLTCNSGTNCAKAKTGGAYDNNSFVMAMLDSDSDAATFNSSSSDLNLPAGSQVLFAGLYWGARLDKGTSGVNASNSANAKQIKFKAPGGTAYQTLTGVLIAQYTNSYNAYEGFYDVTSIVQSAGNGSYWGADVQAGTGADRYAGWAMTVVYSAPGMPLRNLTVFDGFNVVGSGAPQTITVSGFTAPHYGAVDVQLSMVAYEGDLSQTGDYTRLNNTQLATAASPGSNFFDSMNDLNGASVATRNPADRNMLGFDIKNLGASGTIDNGDTSATFTFSSNGDVYYPGVMAIAINLFSPDFTPSVKTVTNLTSGSGDTKPGDILQYTLSFPNTGQDAAVDVNMYDPLPAGVSYVPGSMVLLSQPGMSTPKSISDAADGDQGEYDTASRTVRMRLGCGAAADCKPGGRLAIGDRSDLQFQVKVDGEAGGSTITNVGHLNYTAEDAKVAASYDPPQASVAVSLMADVAVEKSMTPSPAVSGQAGTTTLKVTNLGPNQANNVVVTDPLPDFYVATGVTLSNGGSCATPAPGGSVACALG